MRFRVIMHDWLPFLKEKLHTLMIIDIIGWADN